ncbi:unnamed protein product [Prorocentrum cordatum]|uniref:RNA polymerase alpha subunit C-terminal domain-containing protein n=1 Tax=Prorocentrum cordatum TaxID=2364126 RepID=A0ABN9X3D6_9DINO|nr:unnamed protein product [Polarella glacialis]
MLGRRLQKAHNGCIRWATDSRKERPGRAHRHARAPEAEQLETAGHARVATNPELLQSVWSDLTFDEAKLIETLGEARGIDNISSADLYRLPKNGLEVFAQLLNSCETEGAWL